MRKAKALPKLNTSMSKWAVMLLSAISLFSFSAVGEEVPTQSSYKSGVDRKITKQSDDDEDTLFDRLSDAHISFSRARTGPDSGKGAAFSFVDSSGEDNDFVADYYLSWTPPVGGDEDKDSALSFHLSAEGHISDETKENEDALRFRIGLEQDISEFWKFDGAVAQYFATYESDVDFGTEKLFAEAEIVPVATAIGMGGAVPAPPSLLQFRWEPAVGVNIGKVIDEGDAEEEDGDLLLRLPARIHFEILLNFVDEYIGINRNGDKRTSIYAEPRVYYLPLEGKEKFFFVGGLDVPITDNVSIGLEFKTGESPPDFEDIETYNISFRIGF